MLDKTGHKTLHAPQNGPMYHHHLMLQAILTDIVNIEALWQIKITQKSRPLPQPPQSVFKLDINFRPVKDAFPGIYSIIKLKMLQNLSQRFCSIFPYLYSASVFLRPCRQKKFILTKPKGSHHKASQLHNLCNFSLNLVRSTKNMSIILSKTTHPCQAMQYPGALIAIHGTQLSIAKRQMPVATQLCLIHQYVSNTIHRFNDILHLINIHGGVHALSVEI